MRKGTCLPASTSSRRAAARSRSRTQSGFEIARHATKTRSKIYDLKTVRLKSGGPEKNGRQRTEQACSRADAVFRSARKRRGYRRFSRGEEAQRICVKKELVEGDELITNILRAVEN
jgi:hypothetical protein